MPKKSLLLLVLVVGALMQPSLLPAQLFTNLHSFTGGGDGAVPYGGLILLGNTLYGTALDGGSSYYGTVFALSTNGTRFTIVHNFDGLSDGNFPAAPLISSGTTLFGTTVNGGNAGSGTLFKVNTDGTGFTNLYSFTSVSGAWPNYINSDGATPRGALILLGETLYGTAFEGGSSGFGTLFRVNTDGTR